MRKLKWRNRGRAAGYVLKIAQAAHHVHQRGVLPRDLKPSNMLIDASDEPRITDVSSPEEGMIEIRWTGEAPPYQLQSRDSLSEGDWWSQGEPTEALNATVPADGEAKFFRVLSLFGT